MRLLLLTLACALPVLAQEPEFRIRVDVNALAPKNERWLELRSKNFLVVGNDNEERIRRVAADLELFRVQFALLFPRAQLTSSVSTTVVVFRDGATFAPYRRVRDGKPEDVDGYFQPGKDKNYLVLSDNKPNRAIYRDHIRTLIPDSMGSVPAWFRAGLSEYFTTYRVTWNGDSRWIEVGGRDKEFNGLLRNDSLIPLKSFFESERTVGPGEVIRNTIEYAQAWALTHYLLQEDGGGLVKPTLEFFQTLPESVPLDEGFAAAFSKSIKDFEGQSLDDGHDSGFRGYVREGRVGKYNPAGPRSPGGWYVDLAGFSLDPNEKEIRAFFYEAARCTETVRGIGTIPVVVDVPCGPSLKRIPVNRDVTWADIKNQNVRLLSEAETDFYRGDLMSHIDRLDEAEGLLQLAKRIDPKLPEAYAALGLLQTRQGQQDEALKSLRQALTLADDNYLAHYYYALALMNASQKGTPPPAAQDLATIATELKETVELAPHFVEAKVMLAEVNAQRQQDLDETLDLVREAAKQSPGREDLTLTLARVLAANRNNQEAGRLLDRVAASRTAESFMKDAAEVLRNSISETPEAPAATQEFFARNDEPAQQSVETRAGVDDIPEGVLVPVNPRKLPEGETVSGKLSMLDCSSGLTVVVDVGGKTVRLHSNTPDKIEFVTLSDAVGRSISCGPIPSLPVTIIFRPDNSGTTLGEPIRIEFTEDRSGK